MSVRNPPAVKGQPARKAENLLPYVSRFSRTWRSLDVSHSYGSLWPVPEIALFIYILMFVYLICKSVQSFMCFTYVLGSVDAELTPQKIIIIIVN
jgi:hypothetical protein